MSAIKPVHIVLISLAIIFACGQLYKNTVEYGLTWDDEMLLYEAAGAQDVKDWRFALTTSTDRLYRPLRTISYAIENTYTSGSPKIRHAVNVVLYGLACAMFFIMAMSLFDGDLIKSCVATVAFIVHPIHVEAVASVSNRADLLGALFMFPAIAAFAQRRTFPAVAASLALFVVAMLSKESSIVLPGIIFFVALNADMKSGAKFLKPFLTATAYAALYLIPAALFMLYRGSVLADSAGQLAQYHGGSFAATMLSSMSVVPDYAAMLFYPVIQCAVYDVPVIHGMTPDAALGVAVLCASSIAGLAAMKKAPLISLCLFWMIFCWVPAANIIPIATLKAGRLMFMSSAGASLLFGFVGGLIYETAQGKSKPLLGVAQAVAAVLFLAFLITGAQYSKVWKNDQTLWTDAAACAPNSATAWNNYGAAMLKDKQPEKAEGALLRSIELKPVNPQPYKNLGNLYGMLGQYDKALEYLNKYNAMSPGDPEAGCLISICLKRLGRADESESWNQYCPAPAGGK